MRSGPLTLKIAYLAIASAATFAVSCTTGPDLTNINTATPTASGVAVSEKEISGTFAVTGAAEHGANAYEGSMTLTNQGDTYKADLQTAKLRRTGVAVQFGDALALTLAEAGKGADCGVALYKISPNGVLDGRIVRLGQASYSNEHAQQIEGSNFDGKYKVSGTTEAGVSYNGTIDVKRSVNGYQFTWHTGKDLSGYGMWRGNTAAINFGGPNCYVALYDIASTSLFQGFTGGGSSFAFGTETAKKP
jgi:hypothetical protein